MKRSFFYCYFFLSLPIFVFRLKNKKQRVILFFVRVSVAPFKMAERARKRGRAGHCGHPTRPRARAFFRLASCEKNHRGVYHLPSCVWCICFAASTNSVASLLRFLSSSSFFWIRIAKKRKPSSSVRDIPIIHRAQYSTAPHSRSFSAVSWGSTVARWPGRYSRSLPSSRSLVQISPCSVFLRYFLFSQQKIDENKTEKRKEGSTQQHAIQIFRRVPDCHRSRISSSPSGVWFRAISGEDNASTPISILKRCRGHSLAYDNPQKLL